MTDSTSFSLPTTTTKKETRPNTIFVNRMNFGILKSTFKYIFMIGLSKCDKRLATFEVYLQLLPLCYFEANVGQRVPIKDLKIY